MPVPLRDGLFTMPEDPQAARLLGGRCRPCGRLNFPAQTVCPYCSGDGCETLPLSPRGVLQLCTTVHARPPGYDGPLPFGFGVVELPGGIRIITRVVDPQRAVPGAAVRLVIEPLCSDADGRQVLTYAFALVDS